MKAIIPWLGIAVLALTGCATSDRHVRHHDRYYVIEEHPADRIAVREYESRDYRGTPYNQNNMEPRVRGKHADSLGWNTENYYLQRGY
jgi:hypothetical protein